MSVTEISEGDGDGHVQPDQAGSEDVGPTRRGLLKRGAIAGGAVLTIGAGGSAIAPRFSPVGRAQAIAPIVLVGGVAAVSVGVGWALGEWDPLESDSAPEGLTPGALYENNMTAARTRKSTIRSTYLDNQTIADTIDHAAYADGKVAAIEALNAEKTQSAVTTDAQSTSRSYEETVIKNLLKSWNEAVNEFKSRVDVVQSHGDATLGSAFGFNYDSSSAEDANGVQVFDVDYSFSNGNTFTVKGLHVYESSAWYACVPWRDYGGFSSDESGSASSWSDITSRSAVSDDPTPGAYIRVRNGSGDYVDYLQITELSALLGTLEDTFASVHSGLSTWVDGVYGEVQSGELDTAELLTPAELAEMSADEEYVNQAIADLMALNVPVDLEREATITMQTDTGQATISGMIAPTDPPDGGLQSGETYVPSDMTGNIYFNYDISQGSAEWNQYEAGVDGGTATFTSEPYAETEYRINTTAGESAVVVNDDFTEDTTNGVWTVDISSQVDTSITEIDSVEMTSESGETQYELILLKNEFTIDKIVNSDGEEQDSMTFTQSEPQDDTNYITQDEWDAMRQRNQELIDKYEAAKEDDDGGIFPGADDFGFGDLSWLGNSIIGFPIWAWILAAIGYTQLDN